MLERTFVSLFAMATSTATALMASSLLTVPAAALPAHAAVKVAATARFDTELRASLSSPRTAQAVPATAACLNRQAQRAARRGLAPSPSVVKAACKVSTRTARVVLKPTAKPTLAARKIRRNRAFRIALTQPHLLAAASRVSRRGRVVVALVSVPGRNGDSASDIDPWFSVSSTGLHLQLDATESTAGQGILAYRWTITAPNGTSAIRDGVAASYTGSQYGLYRVRLDVLDATASPQAVSRNVELFSTDKNPIPYATSWVNYRVSDLTIILDARGSTDDNGIVSYEWYAGDLDNLGTPILSTTNPLATWTAPAHAPYHLRVKVTDTNGNTAISRRVFVDAYKPITSEDIKADRIARWNTSRSAEGLVPLTEDACLSRYAQTYADHVAETDQPNAPSGYQENMAAECGGQTRAFMASADAIYKIDMALLFRMYDALVESPEAATLTRIGFAVAHMRDYPGYAVVYTVATSR